jgi:hypothetical protein
VGGAAKALEWSGLRRAGLAQEEKRWWRVRKMCVRDADEYKRRKILRRETSNEGMGERRIAG